MIYKTYNTLCLYDKVNPMRVWLVLIYDLLGDRCIDDITIVNILLVYYLKHWNTTYSVVGVFSNRSQKTSEWGQNITDAIGCTFTFGNALVKEISQQKKLLYYCLFYYLGITICTQPWYSQTTVILSICSLFMRMTCQSHWVPASVNTFSVLITFQCCLWSITGQTQGKMRSIC